MGDERLDMNCLALHLVAEEAVCRGAGANIPHVLLQESSDRSIGQVGLTRHGPGTRQHQRPRRPILDYMVSRRHWSIHTCRST